MEIFILLVLALIVGGIAYLVHSVRKNKKTKTKEERRAQTITAIIIFVIILIFAILRQSIKQDRINDVIQSSNTSQTER